MNCSVVWTRPSSTVLPGNALQWNGARGSSPVSANMGEKPVAALGTELIAQFSHAEVAFPVGALVVGKAEQ